MALEDITSSSESEDALEFTDAEIIDKLKFTFEKKMERIEKAHKNWKLIMNKIKIILIFK